VVHSKDKEIGKALTYSSGIIFPFLLLVSQSTEALSDNKFP
jgi:hypothetical protein